MAFFRGSFYCYLWFLLFSWGTESRPIFQLLKILYFLNIKFIKKSAPIKKVKTERLGFVKKEIKFKLAKNENVNFPFFKLQKFKKMEINQKVIHPIRDSEYLNPFIFNPIYSYKVFRTEFLETHWYIKLLVIFPVSYLYLLSFLCEI